MYLNCDNKQTFKNELHKTKLTWYLHNCFKGLKKDILVCFIIDSLFGSEVWIIGVLLNLILSRYTFICKIVICSNGEFKTWMKVNILGYA